ncbi:thiamine phosphate synthase [Acetobacter estunensis]|uniref:thiamine phosphate synthase n=1 Tax=Acetobacter estunensis TaxID=104097 RepID=UPI001C2CE73B|nr:thiamine phosphate synthase [Acetobacter estunensis]MBV1838779.1 thiamine phosphate synthase [Acetobacter estunensis]
MTSTPSASEPCELYLVTPRLGPNTPLPDFETVLAALRVAAVRLRLEDGSPTQQSQLIERVRTIVHRHDMALMLDGLPELARKTGCDGAHVPAEQVAAARAALGNDLQLGAACGFSRDLAMQAGERGADYVAFGPFGDQPQDSDLALPKWWREMMELPVVTDYLPEQNSGLIPPALLAHSDFLALGTLHNDAPLTALWADPRSFASLF